jgi:hypothetical protein
MAQPQTKQTTGFRAGALAGALALALALGGAWLDQRAEAGACDAPGEGAALARVLERFAPERPLLRLGQRAVTSALRFAFGAGCE